MFLDSGQHHRGVIRRRHADARNGGEPSNKVVIVNPVKLLINRSVSSGPLVREALSARCRSPQCDLADTGKVFAVEAEPDFGGAGLETGLPGAIVTPEELAHIESRSSSMIKGDMINPTRRLCRVW